jgi:GDP-L-fucose synthase
MDDVGQVKQHTQVHPLMLHSQAKQSGSPFVVAGTGKPIRQFAFAEDVAALLLWALDKYDDVEPINLAPFPETEVCAFLREQFQQLLP